MHHSQYPKTSIDVHHSYMYVEPVTPKFRLFKEDHVLLVTYAVVSRSHKGFDGILVRQESQVPPQHAIPGFGSTVNSGSTLTSKPNFGSVKQVGYCFNKRVQS